MLTTGSFASRWRCEATRPYLLDLQRNGYFNSDATLAWRENASRQVPNGCVVEGAEALVDVALNRASARLRSSPYVDLYELAQHLSARVRLITQRPLGPYTPPPPDRSLAERPWINASLRRDTDTWRILAGTTKAVHKRHSVAHELAHVLLYTLPDGEIDNEGWRQTASSEPEEALCNYMARCILMPRSPILERLTTFEQPAIAIRKIARLFRVSVRVAALRWIDHQPISPYGPTVVILWRQLHPFSSSFVRACLRNARPLLTVAQKARSELIATYRTASFEEALDAWEFVTNPDRTTPPLFTQRQEDHITARTIREEFQASLREYDGVEASSLFCSSSHTAFSPFWAGWSSADGAFLPSTTTHARRGSLTAQLGHSASSGSARERVSLGSIRGHHEVFGFAHGLPEKGRRYILTALRPLGPRESSTT